MIGKTKWQIWWWLTASVVGVIILLVLTAKWMRTDESLTDTAKKFIQPDLIYTANIQQHSYFYLLGIDAKDEVNPHTLGRYRYHREWANYIRDQNADEHRKIDSGLSEKLTREGFSEAEIELMKNLQISLNNSPEQFTALVIEQKKSLQALQARERIPLQRLSDLLGRKDYISLVIPPQASGPGYSYIRNLQLLKLVQIQLDSGSKVQTYAQQFHQVLDFTQNRLSLIEKILMQNWLSQMIDLIRLDQKNENNPIMLKNLDLDQLGLKTSLQNELMGNYLLTQYLPHSPEASSVQFEWLYLPNKTFNTIVTQYEVYWKLSETPYTELKQQFLAIEHPSLSKWRLKNAVGHILAQVSTPNFEKYLLMNHILNNKILAFNALSSGALDLELLNQNPEGRRYFQKEGKLCIELPFPKQQLPELNLKQDSCVKI
ncbi:hypothetical protein BS636_01895 [Acinetobacter sp. LoGeW2-3]|uniref:hypothetical protein n=1 Tax=Acinetobacter sp. LoGeW2-3 TaxID=1808001 RepID=UPI000C05A1AE|nr:hypothetical protein [Acinetobacter sp. LoGeW2-3]ATO18511.1 hypothetical protein BS636_01895 [Acinetobacter sp. LoGeW2-3]